MIVEDGPGWDMEPVLPPGRDGRIQSSESENKH